MDVILLERIARLGQMGDKVTVKDGYARNFLLPKGKALRANKANATRFEAERVQLEARNLERKTEAEAVAEKLDGNVYIAVRSAGETGQLYGSVASRDIAATLEEEGFTVGRSQVELMLPIKTIGLHTIKIILHPEVDATIKMNVARSEDEAVRQAAGEDLTARGAFDLDDDEDTLDPEEVFDNPEDAEALADDGESDVVAEEAITEDTATEDTATEDTATEEVEPEQEQEVKS